MVAPEGKPESAPTAQFLGGFAPGRRNIPGIVRGMRVGASRGIGPVSAASLLVLAAACAAPKPLEHRPPPPVVVEEQPPAAVPEPRFYSAEQAIQDILGSELEHVGTGKWPGIERSWACAFRNDRVGSVYSVGP